MKNKRTIKVTTIIALVALVLLAGAHSAAAGPQDADSASHGNKDWKGAETFSLVSAAQPRALRRPPEH